MAPACNSTFGVVTLFVNGVLQNSDLGLKKDVVPLHNILELVQQLKPVSYRWLDSNRLMLRSCISSEDDHIERDEPETIKKEEDSQKSSKVRLGFIAQDLEQVFPDWVEIGEDGYRSIDISQIDAVLVQAIKELVFICEKASQEISSLKEIIKHGNKH